MMQGLGKTRLILAMTLLAGGLVSAQGAVDNCARADRLVAEARQISPSPTALSKLESLYREAVSACPAHPEALNNLADTYERMTRYDDAIAYYRRAAEAYRAAGAAGPLLALPLFGMADTYKKQADTDDALYWYRKGLELDPNDAESLAAVATLTKDDPPGLVRSPSILQVLETPRGPGVMASTVAFNEKALPFEFDSAKLLPEARRQLREIAHALFDALGAPRSLGVLSVGPPVAEIAGHADVRGTDAYNMDLSRRRAEAIAKALMTDYRIPESRLRVTSFGKSQLLCREDTDACHARNRRVEIRHP